VFFLIGLAASDGDAQPLCRFLDVLEVQRDQLRAAEGTGKPISSRARSRVEDSLVPASGAIPITRSAVAGRRQKKPRLRRPGRPMSDANAPKHQPAGKVMAVVVYFRRDPMPHATESNVTRRMARNGQKWRRVAEGRWPRLPVHTSTSPRATCSPRYRQPSRYVQSGRCR
jgi:hypothetical protein